MRYEESCGKKERVFNLVAKKIETIAENAVLVENHVDILHKNPKVQGLHIFALPDEMNGGLWRVQLLVKDVIEPRNERTTVHTIDGIEIHKMENPPVETTQSEGGVSYVEGIAAADNRQVRNVTENGPNDRTATLSQLLGGDKPYIRQDGKGFFDSVDNVSRAKGCVYYERRMNCHRFSTKSAITELRTFLMPLLWLASEVAKTLRLTDGDCTSL